MAYHLANDRASACTSESHYGDFWMEDLGLDISGTLQGAGGIGGLLSVTKSDGTYFPFADGNGNITEYVDTNGAIVAHYEFDPYGNVIAATGDKTGDFSYRFSSKQWDDETGLGYWGYRYYSAGLGRWLGRDPAGEFGGDNLYGYIDNDPIGQVDLLGLVWSKPDRNGKPRARVTCDCGDTVTALADIVGLNATEFMLWLEAEDSKGLPASESAPMAESRVFSVPNKGIVDRGELDWWNPLQNQYMFRAVLFQQGVWWAEGLNVSYNVRGKASAIQSDLRDKDLYKFAYFGHGKGGGLYSGMVGASDNFLNAGRYTSFRINLMRLAACQSNDAATQWRDNVSAKGTLYTVQGILNFWKPWAWSVISQSGTANAVD